MVDTLARQLGIHVDKLQFSAAVGRGRLCEKRILLAKPMTFMNNSGESVGKLARYYKVQHLLHSRLLRATADACCYHMGTYAPSICVLLRWSAC